MPDVIELPLPAPMFPRLYVPAETEAAQEPLATRPFLAPPDAERRPKLTGARSAQYLVLLSDFAMDLPLGLFDNPTEAVEFARDVKTDPDAHAQRYFAAVRVTAVGPRPWIAIAAIEFDGPMPTRRTVLFELD